MTRDVAEHGRTFVVAYQDAPRRFELVVALVGVERPVFVAKQRLVVGQERRTPFRIAEQVEVAGPVGVPREAFVDLSESCGGGLPVEARHEVRGGRGFVER